MMTLTRGLPPSFSEAEGEPAGVSPLSIVLLDARRVPRAGRRREPLRKTKRPLSQTLGRYFGIKTPLYAGADYTA
jgi:hypothetical protein